MGDSTEPAAVWHQAALAQQRALQSCLESARLVRVVGEGFSRLISTTAQDGQRPTRAEALVRIQQLTDALATRGEIGRAQGILMERYGLDADTAFALLRRLSSTSNRKVREIAESIIARQDVDGPSPEPLRQP